MTRSKPAMWDYTFTPAGRTYLQNQWAQLGIEHLSSDLIASLLLYGEEGAVAEAGAGEETFVLTEGGVDLAATQRNGPWFVCLSAYTTPHFQVALDPGSAEFREHLSRKGLAWWWAAAIRRCSRAGATSRWATWRCWRTRRETQAPDFLPKGELYHVPERGAH